MFERGGVHIIVALAHKTSNGNKFLDVLFYSPFYSSVKFLDVLFIRRYELN